MKAVMYHYVRPDDAAAPFWRHLHIDDFRAQLDWFAQSTQFVSRDAFCAFVNGEAPEPPKGVVLTFDDGLKDHARYVAPELMRRGLWGLFYVPTAVLDGGGRLLNVHRIHHLLGRYGGAAMLAALLETLRPDMLAHAHVAEFQAATYRHQDNDAATTEFKRILNYFIADAWRGPALDQLCARYLDEPALCADFYMTADEIAQLVGAGMLVGGHSVSHRVMSTLRVAEQADEIARCFAALEQAAGGALTPRSFCYPYGGFHTFTQDTERLLTEAGCRFAFNVEHRDVTAADLRDRPQALPRYDCNSFPFGQCRDVKSAAVR